MLKVIAYYLLSSLSVLGDSLFLYFVSLTFLQTGQGGILCSIVLGMDAFLEILVGPYVAKFIDAIPELSMRLRRSLLIQVGLMGLAFLPALSALSNTHAIFFLILTIALMRFFFLLDTQLRASLPLSLDNRGDISLIRSLSLSTFSSRCIFLVSSTLSPLLLGRSWLFASSLNSATYIFSFLALLLILRITSKPRAQNKEVIEESLTSPYTEEERRGWLRWNYIYFLLGSFAFGCVNLILTKSMLMAAGESFLFQALRGPSPLYGGLLIALALMLIYHKKGDLLVKNGGRLCIQVFTIGAGLIITACALPSMQIGLLFIIGIVNGFSIVASETFLQRKVAGKNFVKALAKCQAFSRVGFVLSLMCAGWGIDFGLTPNQLLGMAGGVAIVISTLLYFLVLPLERKVITERV